MAVSKETLEKLLVQVRRIAEHREAKAEQNIKHYFAALKKDLNSFLGNEYAKLAEDDKLTYAILQKKGEYARFLEEVINKVDGISPKLKNEVQSLIEETYETCYKGLVKGVEGIDDLARLAKEFKAISAISPETVKRAVQNPIKKLTLNSTLERNRKKVIAGIRREISISLTQGDRMSTMARRISKHVEQDYRKSMLIARTEAHRVRESGFNDAAGNVNTILTDNNSEFRMVKTWKTMKDGAVRHTNLANHVEMDGVTVIQDEDFELKSGAKASCPGMSGIAAEDCNCRCYLSRHIMNDEEYFKATGRHFEGSTGEKTVDKADNSSLPQKPDKKTARTEKVKNGTQQTHSVFRDVTQEYLDDAKPGQGQIIFDEGYKQGRHKEEIKTAEWLHDTFGGDVKLLNEANKDGVKMPDYLWRDKYWELKDVSSINGADKGLQKAIKQIQLNPGGVLIKIPKETDLSALEIQLERRFVRSNLKEFDLMLIAQGKLLKILRCKK